MRLPSRASFRLVRTGSGLYATDGATGYISSDGVRWETVPGPWRLTAPARDAFGGILFVIAATGDSLCANSVWEITAVTTSAGSGATVTTVQGVGVRIGADEMATSCL